MHHAPQQPVHLVSRHRRDDGRALRGFTLIEIIMVVAIIALLIAVTVGIVHNSRKAAGRTKMQLDMQVIGSALEEYKKDHGGLYPQVPGPNTGFAVLVRELIGTYGDGVLPANTPGGPTPPDPNDPPPHDPAAEYRPGDCVNTSNFYVCLEYDGKPQPPPPDARYWAVFNPRDSLDGPGHRTGGRKFPNYLQPDRFRVRGSAILDANDKPILYFPARGNPNINIDNGTPSYCGLPLAGNPKYHVNDNWQFFTRPDNDPLNTGAEKRMQSMMGDKDNNGIIGPGETANATGPYILWSAGPDGFFGPWWNPLKRPATDPITQTDVTKCDDVVSWQQ
ncbi:MAG: hypothetical protein QOF78_2583 [Phycisphaerales bacterium]|nr:hypothetical protein [Phycisphaerales bacterium]